MLADGYRGRALASLNIADEQGQLRVVEGRPAAYVINESTAEVRSIDSAALRLGPVQGVVALSSGRTVSGVGSAGLVVVDESESSATLVPLTGEPVGFEAAVGSDPLVAADGSIWSIVGADVARTTSAGTRTFPLDGADPAETVLSLVGSRPFVVDTSAARARLDDGDWVDIPTNVDPSEVVVQVPGPNNECGWVAANDELWCISTSSIVESSVVPDLDVDGSDFLAIAGDAAALVRRGPASIQRFDWSHQRLLDERPATTSPDAVLNVTATTDLVWIDDVAGEFVWAVNPWGIEAIDKDDGATLEYGDDGQVVNDGQGTNNNDIGSADGATEEAEEREPDNDGTDDPPVAIDDPVTSRAGQAVQVPVTANDYDPDGEAIAVVAVGDAGHGSVEIGTASTVTYTPDGGYFGLDQFTYTIADGNGTEATANVIIELIPVDGTNRPPVGAPDNVETGAGVPVVVEVLLNDIDPDRDPLQIDSFEVPGSIGTVTETVGPSGLSALRFAPVSGFEGDAVFTYRPIDSYGAFGDDVAVTVTVARAGDENRPPVVQPDAVRVRRGVEALLPVLVNDVDPDGDMLTVGIVEPLPEGLFVDVQGEQLAVTVRAGSDEFLPFQYTVDDGTNPPIRGSVLVVVIDDVEPNRPPVAAADSGAVVVGRSVEIEVLANDSDPDGDPLVVVDAGPASDNAGQVVVLAPDRVRFTPDMLTDEDNATVRFTYTIDDGNGHQSVGEVTVTVLPEALPEPPYAQDDSTFTFVNVPVTVDVLRNDGDPSGERPQLVGRPGCASGGSTVVTTDGQVRFTPPVDQSGAFRCTYEVTNSLGLRATASIIISVREPLVANEPPTAVDDQLTIEVRTSQPVNVTANDDDPDGDNDQLTVVSSTLPSLGVATRSGNTITFTAGSVTGVTTINYEVADEEGAVSLGRLSIRVVDRLNQPPIANPDSRVITGPGVPTPINVLSNDTDANDAVDELEVEGVELLSGDGTVTLSGSVVTLTPDPEFVGDLVALYRIRDPGGMTSNAQVILTVLQPLNRAPVAVDDATTVNNGGSVTTSVLFNDSDPDGDDLVLTLTSGPEPNLGRATVSGGSITFNATPGATGTTAMTYSVSDGEFSDSATLRITVRPCSASVPVAADSFLSTGYQQPIAINLDDFASNGTVTDVVGPAGYSNGVYTPPSGENGNVSITYAVVNSCRERDTGRITIDVNQDPVPQATTASIARGSTRDFPVTTLAGDDEALTIVESSGAPNWVSNQASTLTIAPPLGAAARTYSWTTTVRDTGGLTASVPMSVTVSNAGPVANPDAMSVGAGPATAQIVANDVDPDGSAAQLRIQQVPSSLTFSNGAVGTISVSADERSVTVSPGAGRGTASFTYTIVDADGAVSSPAAVTVTGAPSNVAPTAADQSVSVVEGVSTAVNLSVVDADGDPLTVVVVDNADGAVAAIQGRTVTVVAPGPGTFSFEYRVNDGTDDSNAAVLTINATAANVAPVANPDSISVEDGPVTAPIVANDVDPDGSAAQLRIRQVPPSLTFSNGEVGMISVSADERSVTVDPGAGRGTASFSYTIVDADGAVSAPTVVTVTGAPSNVAPTAADQSVSVVEGVSTPVNLSVVDADGDPLTVVVVDNADGAVAATQGSTVTVLAPEPGTFTFEYLVNDGTDDSNTAVLTIDAVAAP